MVLKIPSVWVSRISVLQSSDLHTWQIQISQGTFSKIDYGYLIQEILI